MKLFNYLSKLVLAAILLCGALETMADQPSTKPPRGHAYGYFLKNGTYVLFVYVEDGTRSITLSQAKPKEQYQLDCTEDLVNWQTLTTLTVLSDGTASYVDATPDIPHRYYRVTWIQ